MVVYGLRKAVCEGSIVTKISDLQPTHHTNPILMVIFHTNNHVDYINLCMMSILVSKFQFIMPRKQFYVLTKNYIRTLKIDLGLVIMMAI